MLRPALFLVALAAFAPAAAHAEAPRPLRYDLRTDGAIAAAATVAWIGSELAKDHLAPPACRVCETNGLDAWAREGVVWDRADRARRISDALAFAVIPAAAGAHQLLAARAAGDVEDGFVDVLLVAEATALALDLNQVVKFAVGRERPFVRYGNFDPGRPRTSDDDLSFYSGHTSLAFAIASAAGTVSSLRGYRSAPWVWGVGMTLAATVGYLRMAGDMHYLTDVATGAALGTAIGIAVPRFVHGREDAPTRSGASAVVVPFGVAIVF